MSLAEYNKKRDFKRTKEPPPKKKSTEGRLFVIQKHDATRLHYDFRLELDGVLLSWAVPKGPSLDTKEKRLAVHVEDHPVDYGDFEGIIPQGEYGGGTVMLWDKGTWEPQGKNPRKDYESGMLKFVVHGEKLRGKWMLLRLKPKEGEEDKNWLLIKEKDDEVRTGKYDILKDKPTSVKTGRTLDEIAEDQDATWKSKPRKSAAAPASPPPHKAAVRAPMPETFAPQLATLVDRIPDDDRWLHEIKFDGYRILCLKNGDDIRLISRSGKDWTERFEAVAKALADLPAETAILDGEIVVLDENEVSNFQSLQNAMRAGKKTVVHYYIFDMPHLNGHDIARVPLFERKEMLKELLAPFRKKKTSLIRYSDHLKGSGKDVFEQACRLKLEGIISKRRDGTYIQSRSKDWVKSKCSKRQEFVIVGYTDPGGARKGFGALLIGVYHDGKLVNAGRVGTGFDDQLLGELTRKLKAIERKTSPLDVLPAGSKRGLHWVEPKLVAEVEFTEWTKEGQLRHPSFKGLREDKPAKDVKREATAAAPRIAKGKKGVKPMNEEAPEVSIPISNPDKILYPGADYTKLDLARYYAAAAKWLLPYIKERPLAIVRCPQGSGKKCFFQKHHKDEMPASIEGIVVDEKDGKANYLMVNTEEGLLALAQLGVLEVHPWGSTSKDLEKPDIMIFDLDPADGVAWKEVVEGAKILHGLLDDLGLKSFVKTSGGKGLHVFVPLTRKADWEEVKEFAREVSERMVRDNPKRFVATMTKAKRKGKTFIDFFRNGRGSTCVAAYSPRARAGAPVSVPLDWEELGPDVKADQFTIKNLPERMAELKSDPWEGIFKIRQTITKAMWKKLKP